MLSQTVEYSLRSVVWLASRGDEPQTTQQIAAGTLAPVGYLLARPPKDISVLDVVNMVDPIRRIWKCPLGIAAHGSYLCPLHTRLDAAIAMAESAFRESSIVDMLAEPSRSKPLCNIAGV